MPIPGPGRAVPPTANPWIGFVLLASMLLAATGCAALSALLGGAATAAPAVVSVLDAYAATARAIAPAASQPDLAVLAELLRERDRCVVAASVATMPQLDAGPTDAALIAAALRASAEASARLATAIEAMGAGKDGGT